MELYIRETQCPASISVCEVEMKKRLLHPTGDQHIELFEELDRPICNVRPSY
jgi:hypothetical protein